MIFLIIYSYGPAPVNEREKNMPRPVPAPPGGHIWIRHAKRTRHLARGDVW